ncbi:hypothetical protein CRG98_015477 [Punica granatum]|uniref:Uncharacterized protein n=1 Tax=Punica granatum TaxID=22663 RepID=A0A2I0K7P1_PUNGR|nr:hypothetical protein CRG98_015477 [Punica granatum]
MIAETPGIIFKNSSKFETFDDTNRRPDQVEQNMQKGQQIPEEIPPFLGPKKKGKERRKILVAWESPGGPAASRRSKWRQGSGVVEGGGGGGGGQGEEREDLMGVKV